MYIKRIALMILEGAKTQSPIILRNFHGLLWRLGRGAGAVVTGILAVMLGLSFQVMSLVFLGLLGLWIASALSLRPYLKKAR